MVRRRAQVALPGLLITVSSSLALALATQGPGLGAAGEESPRIRGGGERGLWIHDSKRGRLVLASDQLAPGAAVRGEVRLHTAGSERARLSVRAVGMRDSPGPNGGRLSRALWLRVKRSRSPGDPTDGEPETIYAGPLASFGTLRLGSWRPGERREFEFRVRFPDGGRPTSPSGGDNSYQGSRTRFRLVWRATAV
jgi:hypothetical protein